MTNVAFLGLGAIGRPMAGRVALNHSLTVWNRTRRTADTVGPAIGAQVASSPRDAVREADVVITCLSTSKDVASIVDGPDGIAAGIRSGALFIDCTSGDAATSRTI